ncbi:MAG: galactosyltransferase-related protein [Pseudomonadota bacterium]
MSDAFLTFITTCRGRLEHLQQSLPKLVAQKGAAIVIVDYDCPQGAGTWVEEHHPEVAVVRSGPREHFEAARARNLGAEAATTPWLCFTDADTLLDAGFSAALEPLLAPGGFYTLGEDGSSMGFCVCSRADFTRVQGYDPVLQGWGMEDKDLYTRLELAGLERRRAPRHLVTMILHRNDLRVQHYALKSGYLSSTINFVYCRAKWDLMAAGHPMTDEAFRRDLYAQVSGGMKASASKGEPFTIRLTFRSQTSFSGALVKSSLVYDVEPLKRL